jgi:Bifunctional DNA primase/polymerase, N-terminal
MRTTGNERLETALAYLKRGWSVIPIEARGKRPIVHWLEFQTERPSAATVGTWFDEHPNANIAIVTGALSGLVVLDVDAGADGARSLLELERRHAPLPRTLEVSTGGGGRHLYFRHPGSMLHNRVGFRPGLDVRGDGGCVVAPPSIHHSGRPYVWVSGRAPGDCELVALPRWLLTEMTGSGHHRPH